VKDKEKKKEKKKKEKEKDSQISGCGLCSACKSQEQ
jgi:hypothetical protein